MNLYVSKIPIKIFKKGSIKMANFKETVKNVWGKVVDFCKKAWTAIVTFCKKAWTAVANFFKTVWGKIVSLFKKK